jgi:diadenosine tetraphosphatase ApaH/serine/threonine PP2A family protein phosphatase
VRVLVISDIHSNDTALQAVLADAGAVDETWCLGDLVGYGPDPNQVLERLRALPGLRAIFGNHDAALLRHMELEAFNGDARASLNWTATVLSAENYNFIRSLSPLDEVDGIATLAHGSPRDPTWEYVLNTLAARLNFTHFRTPYCFVGHSHIQSMFELDEEEDRVTSTPNRISEPIPLTRRTIVNPGSVGQPRDRDPRAAYAIFDTEARTWEARRVDYDISTVQKRINDAGLPPRHGMRLAEGW